MSPSVSCSARGGAEFSLAAGLTAPPLGHLVRVTHSPLGQMFPEF